MRRPEKLTDDEDAASSLQRLNKYLEENFPDFFTEACFQIGADDGFLYVRFGQYLAQTIEQNRASTRTITKAFALLNNMAGMAQRHPEIRKLLISGPLEYIFDAPKARALARLRLSPQAQADLESPCE